MKRNFLIICLGCYFALTVGCSSSKNSSNHEEVTKEAVVSNYAAIVYASYDDTLTAAKALQIAVNTLVASPSAQNLTAAKEAWKAARIPYGQTEGYRFIGGPIDDDNEREGQLNAWPLDENYIDYVDGNSGAGIINNPLAYPTISKEVLAELNESGGDKNISAGYHAIEFLLWGQDLSDGAGAGQRPFTDYVTDGSGTASNQVRRAQYLVAVTALLVDTLQAIVDEWKPNIATNYRAEFEAMDKDLAITKILRGIGTLCAGELSTERMSAALDAGEKEEEHSCFSDNTRADIEQTAKSISNVYLGTYTRIDGSLVKGASIYDLVYSKNPTKADTCKDEVLAAVTAVGSIHDPFDQEIKPGNTAGNLRVQSAVEAVQEAGDRIVEIGAVLGLTINTDI